MAADAVPVSTGSPEVQIRTLNCHVTCGLCKGYLIDATTITECLHSFCRSCIVAHVDKSHSCPSCGIQLKSSKIFSKLKSDRTLQSLVYKLVPNLALNELQRRKTFDSAHQQQDEGSGAVRDDRFLENFLATTDAVSLSLEFANPVASSSPELGTNKNQEDLTSSNESVHRRYFRCPAALPIGHLMKFLCSKYGVNSVEYQAEILCGGCPLLPHYRLSDVAYISSWTQKEPLRLSFRFVKLTPVEKPCLTTQQTKVTSTETPDPAPVNEPPNPNKEPKHESCKSVVKRGGKKSGISKSKFAKRRSKLNACSNQLITGSASTRPVTRESSAEQSAQNGDIMQTGDENNDQVPAVSGGRQGQVETGAPSEGANEKAAEKCAAAVEKPVSGETAANERDGEAQSDTGAKGNLPAIVIDSREKCKINAPPDVTSQIAVNATSRVSDGEKPITKPWVPQAVFDLDDRTLFGKRLQQQSEAQTNSADPYVPKNTSTTPSRPCSSGASESRKTKRHELSSIIDSIVESKKLKPSEEPTPIETPVVSEQRPVHDSIGALDLSSRPSEMIPSSRNSPQPPAKTSGSPTNPSNSQGPHPFFLASSAAVLNPLSLLKSSPEALASLKKSPPAPLVSRDAAEKKTAMLNPLSLLKSPPGAPVSLKKSSPGSQVSRDAAEKKAAMLNPLSLQRSPPGALVSLKKPPPAALVSRDAAEKKAAVHEWLTLLSHQLEASRKMSPGAVNSIAAAPGSSSSSSSLRAAVKTPLLKLPLGAPKAAPLLGANNSGRTKQLSAHVRHIPNPSLMQLQRRLASNLPCYLPSKD